MRRQHIRKRRLFLGCVLLYIAKFPTAVWHKRDGLVGSADDANFETVVPSQVFSSSDGGVETPRWVMCATARSRVNKEETPQSLLRGARMILKDYRDNEAVQSRE